MSLEKDITHIKKLVEAEKPIFKAATPAQIASRPKPKIKKVTQLNTAAKVEFGPGKYYVGDICYSLSDSDYDAWGLTFAWSAMGVFELDGQKFAVDGTAYGDGVYYDEHGNKYGVDAGIIGIVPEALWDPDNMDTMRRGGHIFTAKQGGKFSADKGMFYVTIDGISLTIDTVGKKERDEDEENESRVNEAEKPIFKAASDANLQKREEQQRIKFQEEIEKLEQQGIKVGAKVKLLDDPLAADMRLLFSDYDGVITKITPGIEEIILDVKLRRTGVTYRLNPEDVKVVNESEGPIFKAATPTQIAARPKPVSVKFKPGDRVVSLGNFRNVGVHNFDKGVVSHIHDEMTVEIKWDDGHYSLMEDDTIGLLNESENPIFKAATPAQIASRPSIYTYQVRCEEGSLPYVDEWFDTKEEAIDYARKLVGEGYYNVWVEAYNKENEDEDSTTIWHSTYNEAKVNEAEKPIFKAATPEQVSHRKSIIPDELTEIAEEVGLSPERAQLFKDYVNARWPNVYYDYAKEWAERFLYHLEWGASDSKGQAILKRLKPYIYEAEQPIFKAATPEQIRSRSKYFTAAELRDLWRSPEPYVYKGKKYRVGKMSYGDYYFEPYDPLHPEGKGELSPFEEGTLWAYPSGNQDGLYVIEAKIDEDTPIFKAATPEQVRARQVRQKRHHLRAVFLISF